MNIWHVSQKDMIGISSSLKHTKFCEKMFEFDSNKIMMENTGVQVIHSKLLSEALIRSLSLEFLVYWPTERMLASLITFSPNAIPIYTIP